MDTRRYNSEVNLAQVNFTQCTNTLAEGVYVTSPGAPYDNPVPYSHYNQPLEKGGIRGYSRIWGDAPRETQSTVISQILTVGRRMKFNDEELAFALSVARTESGFNPDAAAGTTSASGVGQLIDRTAENLGVRGDMRFDVKENVNGFLSLLGSVLKTSRNQLPRQSQNKIFERAYGLYHDGPSLKYGGQNLAKKVVTPQIPLMLDWIRCNSLKILS
jgi:putative chitinase